MFERADCARGAGLAGVDAVPGAGLAAVLAGADLTALGEDALLGALAACERMTAWAQALQHEVVLAFAGRMDAEIAALPGRLGTGPAVTAAELTEAEIAATLCLSLSGAASRAHLARALAVRPLTRAALRAGVIDLPRRARSSRR